MRITNEVKNYIFKRIDERAQEQLDKLKCAKDSYTAETNQINNKIHEKLKDLYKAERKKIYSDYVKKGYVLRAAWYNSGSRLLTVEEAVTHDASCVLVESPTSNATREAYKDFEDKVAQTKEDFLLKLLCGNSFEELKKALDEIKF